MELIIKNGKKYYPVGKWHKYQHVFYNYEDRCANEWYETDSDEAYEKFEKSQDILNKWETNPQRDGIVYALYNDYKLMKDIIGGYMWRHNGVV